MGTKGHSFGALWPITVLLLHLAIFSGTALAQNEPSPQPVPQDSTPAQSPQDQKPPEEKKKKKDEGSNPAQAAAEKTKEVTVQAAQAAKDMGTAALVKARDWEGGWLTGVYVEKGRLLVPMSVKQRREIYLQQTLASPGAYMKRMFAAGIDQARGAPSEWGGGLAGYSRRFASREGQFITANSLAALGNAKLKYEPRYDQCQCSGFWPRTRHAIMRNFLTYNRRSRNCVRSGHCTEDRLLEVWFRPHGNRTRAMRSPRAAGLFSVRRDTVRC